MPDRLVRWLREGHLAAALEGDLLVGLYEAARDFNCVGGMLFPVFCFVYWPMLALLALVGAANALLSCCSTAYSVTSQH